MRQRVLDFNLNFCTDEHKEEQISSLLPVLESPFVPICSLLSDDLCVREQWVTPSLSHLESRTWWNLCRPLFTFWMAASKEL